MKKKKNIFFIIIIFISLMIFSKNEIIDSFGFFNEISKVNISHDLEIYFFDVGQADSILIKERDNTVLIDAGNNEDGEKIVDYLKEELSLSDIDIVIGTHPHEDHIGGLDNIIDSFDIGRIYMPDVISTSKTFEEVLNVIENKKYYVDIPKIDNEIILGNMLFEILYTGNDESDLNNSSIVMKLKFGNTSYLFTGDATDNVEKLILNKNLKSDVLKVGHHGSKYSTTNDFLDKVNPEYAIIMVGEDNSYGHPTKNILDKLNKRNIKVYRTDKDGTIKITSDGNFINVESLNVNLDG